MLVALQASSVTFGTGSVGDSRHVGTHISARVLGRLQAVARIGINEAEVACGAGRHFRLSPGNLQARQARILLVRGCSYKQERFKSFPLLLSGNGERIKEEDNEFEESESGHRYMGLRNEFHGWGASSTVVASGDAGFWSRGSDIELHTRIGCTDQQRPGDRCNYSRGLQPWLGSTRASQTHHRSVCACVPGFPASPG